MLVAMIAMTRLARQCRRVGTTDTMHRYTCAQTHMQTRTQTTHARAHTHARTRMHASTELVAAIDQGTSSSRVIIFDAASASTVVASHQVWRVCGRVCMWVFFYFVWCCVWDVCGVCSKCAWV